MFIRKTPEEIGLNSRYVRRFLGRLTHLPGRLGRSATLMGYRVSRKIFGFN